MPAHQYAILCSRHRNLYFPVACCSEKELSVYFRCIFSKSVRIDICTLYRHTYACSRYHGIVAYQSVYRQPVKGEENMILLKTAWNDFRKTVL